MAAVPRSADHMESRSPPAEGLAAARPWPVAAMAEEGDTVIARVLRATTRSEEAALAVAALWGRDVGPSERSAPGYEGGILLREGADVLVVSCWADLLDAEAALDPMLLQLARSPLLGMLIRPLSCRVRSL
jgi:hypothetical protein